MSTKKPVFNEQQWRTAQEAVAEEYENYLEELRSNGVDYTIKNARKLLIYQDLLMEWKHKLPTVISDLEDNPFALSVFDDLKKKRGSQLLQRGYDHIANWPDFNPTPLTLWLELEEDVSI
ncbi:hypothetical protein PL11_008145 [Lentilactobacillus curieae]|uniref:Uncharacterized protein n=1 Tax=Lentilactobacillus curieae TaxID=1138822 RepID=A0A1S6QJV2_9LACO|nr:hypothetical protein [Lentilactobacillus curieae]AQW21885.1 hypothetical protein PL11_008145 [Lentilactobacillus curieae]